MAKKETKKSRRERCQALIDRQPMGVLFSPPDLAEFMELTGKTLLAAVHQLNPSFPKDPRYVRVKYPDGSWDGISWNNCISEKSAVQMLKIVLRAEVASDICEARQVMEPICARCGSTDYPTVDHMYESFDSIATAFIAQHGPIETVPYKPGGEDMMADRDLAGKWIHLHASRASYQILCRSCNASKGKRGT